MKKNRFIPAILTAAGLLLAACTSVPGEEAAPPPVNLAYGKYASSNNHIFDFTADRAFDGEVLSYWEGGANAYPNDLTVDLGKPVSLGRLVLKLNPKRIWSPRTQTLEVLTSPDGTVFTSVLPPQAYDFDPIDGDNSVTIPADFEAQFLRLRFTANTEANAGQVAELEIYSK